MLTIFADMGTATYTNDLAEGRSMKLIYEGVPKKMALLGSIKPDLRTYI